MLCNASSGFIKLQVILRREAVAYDSRIDRKRFGPQSGNY